MTRLLQEWITASAERNPDQTAVVMEDERLTYAALEQQSNRMARLLRSLGCRRPRHGHRHAKEDREELKTKHCAQLRTDRDRP